MSEMAAIISVAQMRAVEAEANRKGLTYDRMMDYAGRAVFEEARRQYGPLQGKRILVLCGGGKNGGDGLVAALHFAGSGVAVRVYLASEREKNDPRVRAAVDAGIPFVDATAEAGLRDLSEAVPEADLILDAVLGTGARLPLRSPVAKILNCVGESIHRAEKRPRMVAVDCPSGLDCDSGEVPPQILTADLTVTLGAAKPGLLKFPGGEYVGRLVVADIGLPRDLEALHAPGPILATPDLLRGWLKPRPRASHKGTFGRVLVIGGSINFPGAPVLAGQGAYRSGAGLVTLAVPETIYSADVPSLPEATWIVLPEDFGVISAGAAEVIVPELERFEAVVAGPGFGREKATSAFLKGLLQAELGRKTPIGFGVPEKNHHENPGKRPPMVIDADALKMLSEIEGWPSLLPPGSVLTPHPGEMAILTGMARDDIQKDRQGVALRFAKEWKTTVILKGAYSVIASPEGDAAVEPFATPALARAGTGDVLSGVVGGLIAQGMEAWRGAVLGAYLHGRAGEIAAEDLRASDAVLARDVANSLARAIAELRGEG
jgi:NAD(P)H-hydrate epimerase